LTTVLAPRFSALAEPFSTLVSASWRSSRRLSSSGLGSSSDVDCSLAVTAGPACGGAAVPDEAELSPIVAARARLNSPADTLRTIPLLRVKGPLRAACDLTQRDHVLPRAWNFCARVRGKSLMLK
jgi:hypothetical protein